jgi:hypothetical protein
MLELKLDLNSHVKYVEIFQNISEFLKIQTHEVNH